MTAHTPVRRANFGGKGLSAVSCAEAAEPIDLPFGLRTQVSPRNHVLDWRPDPPWEEPILTGEKASHCKA